MTTNVTPNAGSGNAGQPDRCADISTALRLLAGRFADLIGSGVPLPSVQLNIQPGAHGTSDESVVRAVDAVTFALLGHAGTVQHMSNGTYHYNNGESAERVGPVGVRIFNAVSAEFAVKRDAAAKLAEREAELATLRAEVEKLRAESGLAYSRVDDGGPEVAPGRVDPHTGAVTDCGLVDETSADVVAEEQRSTDADGKAWTHYRAGQEAKTACDQQVSDLPWVEGTSSDHAEVTCKGCIDGLPV